MANLVFSKIINDLEILYKTLNLYGNYYLDQIQYKLGIVDDLSTPHPLFTAVKSKNPELVQYIVNLGADVNVKDKYGCTPIVNKAPLYSEEFEIVRILVTTGADVNAKCDYGETPLILNHRLTAYSNNTLNNSKLLIKYGANVNAQDACGKTALFEAVDNIDIHSAQFLIDSGADVNIATKIGETPLHLAVRHKKTDIAELLIENGADVNAKTNIGETPLYSIYWAHGRDSKSGYINFNGGQIRCSSLAEPSMYVVATEMAMLLAESGADVDARDKDGYTLLHRSVLYGPVERVKLLVDSGADIYATDNDGYTALYYSIKFYDHTKLTKLLLQDRTNLNLTPDMWSKLLLNSIMDKDASLAKLAIENGACFNTNTDYGLTPIASSDYFRANNFDLVGTAGHQLNLHLKASANDPGQTFNFTRGTDMTNIDVLKNLAAQINTTPTLRDLVRADIVYDKNDAYKYKIDIRLIDSTKIVEFGETPAISFGTDLGITSADNIHATNEDWVKFIAQTTEECNAYLAPHNPFATYDTCSDI